MEHIYHCNKDSSNKRWSYEIQGNNVVIRYGRIGLVGQEDFQEFSSTYDRDKFIAKKIAEKERKGYVKIDKQKLTEETKTAQSIGWQYKISDVQYVDKQKNGKLHILDGYDPKKYILVEVMQSWSKEKEHLLLSKTSSARLTNLNIDGYTATYTNEYDQWEDSRIKAIRNYIKVAAAKVIEIITQKFACLGVRNLGDDDAEVQTQDFSGLIEAVNDKNLSANTIAKFASLGQRCLDL